MKYHDGPHKYHRVDIGRGKPYKVYRCALPNCPHYMPNENLVEGKSSICWDCGVDFVLIKSLMVLKPTCHECSKKRLKNKGVDFDAIEEALSHLGK